MSFTKITAEDTANKGVVGLADTPNLSTQEMQEKFDELATDVIIPKFNALSDELDAKDYDTLIAERVVSADITNIRLNADNQLETSLDGGETWETSASSGHIIENGAGTMFPSRARMQFSDNVTVVDKPTDNKTFISIPAGEKGDKGESATIRVGTVASGTEVKIENVGSDTDAIFNFEIPKGDNGSAATIRVGSVQSGTNASVYNSGTTSDAVFNFVLPKGDKGDTGTSFQILGMYATYADLIAAHPTGQRGAAYAVGTSDSNVIYNWNTDASTWDNLGSLQGAKGDTGNAATVTVGTVTTGATSNVENVGTSENAVFNFTLEKGAKGDTGSASTIAIGTVTNGDYPSVTNVGTDTNAIFDIVLQRGEQGAQGTPTTVNGKTAANIELDTRDMLMTGYVKSAEGDIATTDTLAVALSKLETRKSGGSIISVTVDDELVGENITCENGSETYTKVSTSTTEFNVESVGEWTITCGENSTTVEITYFGIYDCEIHARGQYNYEGWLESASISETFSSLEEVLADEKTLRVLMTKHDSADYLSEWCESDEEVAEQILGTDLVAKWVNLRDYCLDKLYSVASVKAIMDTIGKYGFGEWVLKALVPTMTSNTAPSGECIGINAYDSGHTYFRAFDNSTSTTWSTTVGTTVGAWVGYDFGVDTVVNEVSITPQGSNYPSKIKVQGKSGDTWVDVNNKTYDCVGGEVNRFALGNTTPYKAYRIYVLEYTGTSNNVNVQEVQFLAWTSKGLVPTMTSNSAPYGEAFGSTVYDSTSDYYRAFDGVKNSSRWACKSSASAHIGYKFTNPCCVKKFYLLSATDASNVILASTCKLQGSNDGSAWEDIGTSFTIPDNSYDFSGEVATNNKYYLYYRVYLTSTSYATHNLSMVQFYGRQLSVSVPKMDTNTSPWGEAFGNDKVASSTPCYKAFDRDSSTSCDTSSSGDSYIGYKFPSEAKVLFATVTRRANSLNDSTDWKVQGLNSSNAWIDLGTFPKNNASVTQNISFTNDIDCTDYRVYMPKQNYGGIIECNFYALDYSEHTERHYIYDNGVEVEEVDSINTLTKESDCLHVVGTASSGVWGGEIHVKEKIDLTPYKLVRAKIGNKALNYANTFMTIFNTLPIAYSNVSNRVSLNTLSAKEPNNSYLDISQFSDSKYVAIADGESADTEIKAWWLE